MSSTFFCVVIFYCSETVIYYQGKDGQFLTERFKEKNLEKAVLSFAHWMKHNVSSREKVIAIDCTTHWKNFHKYVSQKIEQFENLRATYLGFTVTVSDYFKYNVPYNPKNDANYNLLCWKKAKAMW